MDWARSISIAIMPFLNGTRKDSDNFRNDDGYVSVDLLLMRWDIDDAEVGIGDLMLLRRAQCVERENGEFIRNFKCAPF